MRKFEPAEEATETAPGSDRLEAFTKALYQALVPNSGACVSVQGELVRANERLCFANWCLANPELIDRHGRPVEERGIRDLSALIQRLA